MFEYKKDKWGRILLTLKDCESMVDMHKGDVRISHGADGYSLRLAGREGVFFYDGSEGDIDHLGDEVAALQPSELTKITVKTSKEKRALPPKE
jgi:hypothetical protein